VSEKLDSCWLSKATDRREPVPVKKRSSSRKNAKFAGKMVFQKTKYITYLL
jgi:hypothetical protein